jgi:hypothetical protein
MSFHPGEIAVQIRAGVREEAERLCSVVGSIIKPVAQEFLRTQHLAIASTVDANGSVWASLLTGDPGFIQVLSDRTVQIDSLPVVGDPLHQNLSHHPQIGLLVIDLTTRRRLRLNGQVERLAQQSIIVEIQQAFFNCPKYIQTRHLETTVAQSTSQPKLYTRETLNQADRHWIITADTFFIATFHRESGADASHRGGFPGFVQVLNPNKLAFPDYAGNNMFQTFGNLEVNPKAGLLLIDFEQGHTLQMTGTAEVIWETEQFANIAGAQRLVEFAIAQVLETHNATPRRWQFGDYSPFNPDSLA